MKRINYLLILLVLISAACTSVRARQNDGNLAGTSWKLASFGSSAVESPIIQGSAVTLMFDRDGQVIGNGGCNSFSATYETNGNDLTFKDLTSTLMACADDQVTQQETQFFTALKNASRYEINGNHLTIWYGADQNQLNFDNQ